MVAFAGVPGVSMLTSCAGSVGCQMVALEVTAALLMARAMDHRLGTGWHLMSLSLAVVVTASYYRSL